MLNKVYFYTWMIYIIFNPVSQKTSWYNALLVFTYWRFSSWMTMLIFGGTVRKMCSIFFSFLLLHSFCSGHKGFLFSLKLSRVLLSWSLLPLPGALCPRYMACCFNSLKSLLMCHLLQEVNYLFLNLQTSLTYPDIPYLPICYHIFFIPFIPWYTN